MAASDGSALQVPRQGSSPSHLPCRSASLPTNFSDSDEAEVPGEEAVSSPLANPQAKLVAEKTEQDLCCDQLALVHSLVALTRSVGALGLKMDQQMIQLERLGNDLLAEKRQNPVQLREESHTCEKRTSKVKDSAARLGTAAKDPLSVSVDIEAAQNAFTAMSWSPIALARSTLADLRGQSPTSGGAATNSVGSSSHDGPVTPYTVEGWTTAFKPTKVNQMVKLRTFFKVDETGNCLVQFSNGLIWNCTCAFLIVVQAAVTGIEVELNVKQRMDQRLLLEGQEELHVFTKFTIVEVCFLLWMFVELFVNAYGATRGFKEQLCVLPRKSWSWNYFDVTIIVLSLVQLSTGHGSALAGLRILRLARLGKLMRNLRHFKILRSIHNVIISLKASLSVLVSSFLVMSLFIYVVALLILQGIVLVSDEGALGPAKRSTSDLSYWADGDTGTPMEQLFRLYGSVPRTMLTLFMPVSGGMEWADASRPVVQLNSYFMFIWIAYVAFMFIGLLNVLVGIFVDGAMNSVRCDSDQMARDEVETLNATVARIERVFRASDSDCSGCLDRQEFETLLSSPQLVTQLQMIGVDTSQALTIFRLCDGDCSGTVSYEEFIGGCLRLRGSAKSADMMTLLYQSEKHHRQLCSISKEVKRLSNKVKQMRGSAAADARLNQGKSYSTEQLEPWLMPWKGADHPQIYDELQ
jgi:hypothetical protein